MKKTRILILAMSLSALTPALLGNAWGVENRNKNGKNQECGLDGAKYVAESKPASMAPKQGLSKKGI